MRNIRQPSLYLDLLISIAVAVVAGMVVINPLIYAFVAHLR